MTDKPGPREMWYQRAIEIVTQDHDWRQICISIAQIAPEVLCKAVGQEPWQVNVRLILASKGKVEAIRHVRAIKGCDLKKGKEIVDRIQEEMK